MENHYHAHEVPMDRAQWWDCSVCGYAWTGCADDCDCPRCENPGIPNEGNPFNSEGEPCPPIESVEAE